MWYLLNDGIGEKAECTNSQIAQQLINDAESVQAVSKTVFLNSSYPDVTQPSPDQEDSRFGWLK